MHKMFKKHIKKQKFKKKERETKSNDQMLQAW